MKIIVYNDDFQNDIGEGCTPVSMAATMDRVIEELEPGEDIDGIITPDAYLNKNFRYIIVCIYVQKKRLYDSDPTFSMRPIHEDFKKKIKDNFLDALGHDFFDRLD